ncbi:MAG: vitamin K epoxide reductase family protein [Armatimonadetes bacterium]|nr:vitamin K epoxide reductase family protein [Armatimonadota bacterium]
MVLAIVTLVLSIVGFLDSLYFTLVHYGYFGIGSPLVSTVCRIEVGECSAIASTPWAEAFGVPNSIFGMIFYLMIFAASIVRMAFHEWPMLPLLIGSSIVVAAFSIVLAWALIFRMRALCPLCFTAQAINIILALIFIYVYRGSVPLVAGND